MFRIMGRFILVCIIVIALYMFLWPVPLNPEVWRAPEAPSASGDYAPNNKLANIQMFGQRAGGKGPEDVAVDQQGRLFAGYDDGAIMRMDNPQAKPVMVANTGGRPLGLDFAPDGRLIIADAKKGLLALFMNGQLDVLATEANGLPFKFTDDVDVAVDGTIYFTDASSKFNWDDTATMDIIEHSGNGRLMQYEPITGQITVLLDNLQFANGVAVSADESYVLVNETGSYRTVQYWLEGSKQGKQNVFIANLPGFPDGISTGENGIYWLAIFGPRNTLLDFTAAYPWMRKMLLRLPQALQPHPPVIAYILGLDADGQIIYNGQDTSATAYGPVTSVEQVGPWLYLGSLTHPSIGRVPLPK